MESFGFVEEVLKTRITHTCDVLVCGGGVAGISAALAAVRHGKRVTLIEREFQLGGLGTSGLVTIYLPLCDGNGRQVSFGIAEELLRLSVSMGHEDDAHYCANWIESDDPAQRGKNAPRFQAQYNPHLFAILAEQLLVEAGVNLLYGTVAAAVHRTGDVIDTVIVENKSGRSAIQCKTVVDASGDCDIAAFSGAPVTQHEKGNILAGWYYSVGAAGYQLKLLGFAEDPTGQVDVPLLSKRRFTGLDAAENTAFMQMGHAEVIRDIQKRREKDPDLIPVTLPTIPQFRMTRKIVGEAIASEADDHRYQMHSIGMVSDWHRRGPVYEVPFEALYSAEVKNLITAGRCVSCTDTMWDILRVIPCCAVTGQAAGTAAALFEDFSHADIKLLQKTLCKDGVVLHEKDLPSAYNEE